MTDPRDNRTDRDHVTRAMVRLEMATRLLAQARSEVSAIVGRNHDAAKRLVALEHDARRVTAYVEQTVLHPLRRVRDR